MLGIRNLLDRLRGTISSGCDDFNDGCAEDGGMACAWYAKMIEERLRESHGRSDNDLIAEIVTEIGINRTFDEARRWLDERGPDCRSYFAWHVMKYRYGDSESVLRRVFQKILIPDGVVAIRSHVTGRYWCADCIGRDDYRQVLANRDKIDEWEKFAFVENGDGTVSIKAKANGKFLTVEIHGDGRLDARADDIGEWERFELSRSRDGGFYVLRSRANGKCVVVDPESHVLSASADEACECSLLAFVTMRL